jgi:DNA (cytosine-5)-methyltransferase 1
MEYKMKIPILSYFTGAGFLDLGFDMEGFNIIWTNEKSEVIAKVYHSGMSSLLGLNKVITSIEDLQNIDLLNLKRDVSDLISDNIWGIIGGPPCPDFSNGGKNKGKDGEVGKLSKLYTEHICKLKPDFFVFENVKGLVKTAKHRIYFDELIEEFKQNGYAIDFKLVNALNFGIPQDRERVILIGFKTDIYSKIFSIEYSGETGWFPWPIEIYENAKIKYNWNEVGNNDIIPQNIPIELTVGNYILNQEELSTLNNSQEYFKPRSLKISETKEGDTSRKSFKRLHRWKYSPTVAYGNNEVHLHPTLNRRLSVREALRLQSVPDEYCIDEKISLSTKFKAIGNGVPVKLSIAIAKSIKDFLNLMNG